MNHTLETILFFIFLILSLIHFYWALGGKKGIAVVVPVDQNNKKMLKPTPLASVVVACGLLFLAFLQVILTGRIELNSLIGMHLDGKYYIMIQCFFAIIFILRSIGDFNSVGFFKKITHSKFARLDTMYFSPLSLMIGILMFLVVI